jgi:hypothetical protein
MIDIEVSVSTWRSCFSAFYVFCLRSGKGLTRRANQEHKNIIAEFVNARSGITAAGILLPAVCDNQRCAGGSHALRHANMDVDTSGKSAA